MGKKSRRNKAPRRTRKDVDDALAPFVGAADEYEPGDRFRLPEEYGIDDQKARVLGIEHYKISGGVEFLTSLRESGKEDEEMEMMTEFMYLTVFPTNKKKGFEAALRMVRRWPRFRPYWRRVRRRVCEYCGKRNDLSEPRLKVCSGCGVARYCDETCQANDFESHNQVCLVLACRWNGVGPLPFCLSPLVVHGRYQDKALIPNARARERIREELEAARFRSENK